MAMFPAFIIIPPITGAYFPTKGYDRVTVTNLIIDGVTTTAAAFAVVDRIFTGGQADAA